MLQLKEEDKTYSSDSQAELTHGVKSGGAAVKDFLDELGNGRASSPVTRKFGDLLLGRNFASDQEPEKTLREGFGPPRSLGEQILNFRNSFTAEANALLCIDMNDSLE